jgi:uncharacterized protein involved in exopolysaccharide biosynthesis
MNESRQDEINLLDYWRVLVKHKKLIGYLVGAAFSLSIIVSLLLPVIYASTASVLPPQQDNSIGLGIASQLPEGLGGLAGGFLGTKSPTDLWVGILNSQTIRDAIIERFDLKHLYKADTIEDARKELDKRVRIEKSKKEEIISITVEDRDPKRATDMANAFVEELDLVNKRVLMTAGGRMRAFVEKRLKETQRALNTMEDQVKNFQEKNKAIKLDDQSKAIFEAIGTMKGQLMAKQVELQTLLSYATPENPQVGILQTEVEELKERLRELEEGKRKSDNPSPKDIFIPTARMPDLALQYARLLRDAKVQETLFGLLTQQYEIAQIQEAKDSPTVQFLDIAKVPEKRVKPKRTLIVLLSTFTATFLAIFFAFFLEYLERIGVTTVRVSKKARA